MHIIDKDNGYEKYNIIQEEIAKNNKSKLLYDFKNWQSF